MLLAGEPITSGQYWQAAKNYKGRVLRLSILIAVLALLIVNTVPATYLGTAKIQFSPRKIQMTSGANQPFAQSINQQQLESQYEKTLSENIAQGVLIKLKKFRLIELDSELENAFAEHAIMGQIKQKVRSILPFMPQQDSKALSSKQLKMLKNNYTLALIMQNLHLRYSPSQSEVFVEYKDQSAIFAIIIAKLAADVYEQSVSATQVQMFEQVLNQIKQTNTYSHARPTTSDTVNAKANYPVVERSIELTSQQVKSLKRQVKDSNQRWKDIVFIRNKVREYGLNVALLLRHKQVAEHPAIQAFKQNVEIAEMKLRDLALLPQRVPSQVAGATQELLLVKASLDWELTLLASNVNSYFAKAKHERLEYKAQLKLRQQKIQDLTRLHKALNQFPAGVGNHQINKLQQQFKHINRINLTASFADNQSTDTHILIGNYTTERLKPNRVLIVSLSFFLSFFVISLLVCILVRLKATHRQNNLLLCTQKRVVNQSNDLS